MTSKFTYLRERLVNAAAMLRRGDFSSMRNALYMEFVLRLQYLQRTLGIRGRVTLNSDSGSRFPNPRKNYPASYRPTGDVLPAPCQPSDRPNAGIDRQALSAQLQSLIDELPVPKISQNPVRSTAQQYTPRTQCSRPAGRRAQRH